MQPDISLHQREIDSDLLDATDELHPVIRRIYAARGVSSIAQTRYNLKQLMAPRELVNIGAAADLLADHLQQQSSILIFGDYDADGATSTAVCLRALRLLGHQQVEYLLPDRLLDGYGVSESAASRIIEHAPELVISVDTGIASHQGIARLKEQGIDVIVTDHHLPAGELPNADVIVNPNAFADSGGKFLAGVGVAFYLMLALRERLRKVGWFVRRKEPNLAQCLDLVALGTVADLVPLDFNNRILVHEGLKRIRAGACSAGLASLIELSGRAQHRLSSQDIAFSIAPRINAAGRLDNMQTGVEALLAEDALKAQALASELDQINQYRRELQDEMTRQAQAMLPTVSEEQGRRYCNVLFNEEWHEGIVGIIASRIKDQTFRPSVSFASSSGGTLKGSCRSIPGVHIRDMLDLVDKQLPGVIQRFGGHAMAAGVTIQREGLEAFGEALETVIRKHNDADCFNNTVYHDGILEPGDHSLEFAKLLHQAGPWGQKFPVPSFYGEFEVLGQRVVGERHLKFQLGQEGALQPIDAICFYPEVHLLDHEFDSLSIHYELSINEYRNEESPQLMIRHIL